jgi:hypothetical protein
MSVKGLQLLTIVVAVFATTASAQEQPRSVLGGSFDLKAAVLSPTPLGPPSRFEPPAVTARAEAAPAVAKSKAAAPRKMVNTKPRQKTAVAARKPKSNPLDSYARDTRRQNWPCTGGGICAWTQPR